MLALRKSGAISLALIYVALLVPLGSLAFEMPYLDFYVVPISTAFLTTGLLLIFGPRLLQQESEERLSRGIRRALIAEGGPGHMGYVTTILGATNQSRTLRVIMPRTAGYWSSPLVLETLRTVRSDDVGILVRDPSGAESGDPDEPILADRAIRMMKDEGYEVRALDHQFSFGAIFTDSSYFLIIDPTSEIHMDRDSRASTLVIEVDRFSRLGRQLEQALADYWSSARVL